LRLSKKLLKKQNPCCLLLVFTHNKKNVIRNGARKAQPLQSNNAPKTRKSKGVLRASKINIPSGVGQMAGH
jgi:hypothetical protein